MFGVIWTCQLVHYPLFARVGADRFVEYEAEHMRRIGKIVGPAMAVELLTAAWLVAAPPRGLEQGGAAWLVYVGAGLVVVNWASTFALQGPMHVRLSKGSYDDALVKRLVRTNWVRRTAWTIRFGLALLMLAIAASADAWVPVVDGES